MPDFDLSISICSWNTRDDLRACLASLEACRGEASFEVVVVDNASVDGSADMVEHEFPWVRLMRQSVNLGFTGGHNLAMRHRNASDAMLLNSDTVVHPGAIETLVKYAAEHPEAGLIGPKLLNPNGSLQLSCRKFPHPLAALFRNTLLGRVFPNNRYTREYLMSDFSHNEAREVDWLSGAALVAKEEVIEQVGMLDEGYFMYCEDVDWCWRANEAGFGVVYVPSAVITHAIGRSTDRVANRMIVRHARSMLRFFRLRQLPEYPAYVRPLLWIIAAAGLWTRAGLFLVKNAWDALRRRLRF